MTFSGSGFSDRIQSRECARRRPEWNLITEWKWIRLGKKIRHTQFDKTFAEFENPLEASILSGRRPLKRDKWHQQEIIWGIEHQISLLTAISPDRCRSVISPVKHFNVIKRTAARFKEWASFEWKVGQTYWGPPKNKSKSRNSTRTRWFGSPRNW